MERRSECRDAAYALGSDGGLLAFTGVRNAVWLDSAIDIELGAWVTALDEDRDDLLQMASAAKARCSAVASQITREAIQMFGGVGMTDEEEIGLFFKRAKAAELTLGDAFYHRDRYAALRGF